MKTIMKTESGTKSISWAMLIIWVVQIIYPSVTFAGGGGPTQPEVQGFTPVGVSDMVDPFTGDFTYNIPLMNIDGYPVNIAYNSGVSMDQEASWVGLGWNLNMGAVVRNMRGIPDDFNGDEIAKTEKMKPNINVGLSANLSPEVFAFRLKKKKANDKLDDLQISANLGVNYSNYQGWGVNLSVGPEFDLGKKLGLKVGFDISGSSENGPGFSPSLNYSKELMKKDGYSNSLGIQVGAGFNSRDGLQSVSYGASMKSGKYKKNNSYSDGLNSSFDFGLNNYSPTAGPNMIGGSISASFAYTGTLFGMDGQFVISANYSQQQVKDVLTYASAFGYLYHQNGVAKEGNKTPLLDFNRDNDGTFTKNTPFLPSAFQTYDIFSIQAQGVGGSFRPYRNDVSYVYDPAQASFNGSSSLGFELGGGNAADVGADISLNATTSRSGMWSDNNSMRDYLGPRSATDRLPIYSFVEANEKSVDVENQLDSKFLNNSNYNFTINELNNKKTELKALVGGAPIVSNLRNTRLRTNNEFQFITIEEYKNGLGVSEYPTNLTTVSKAHHIGEITQLGTDGRRYVFGLPAYNLQQEDVSFSVGANMKGEKPDYSLNYQTGWFETSSLSDLASENNNYSVDEYYNSKITPAYAHSYMLTAVLSDDYSDVDNVKGPSKGDFGSYVAFDYEKVSDHEWRTPMQENTAYFNEGLKIDGHDDKASFVHGKKELWYVKKIETKNYIALFYFFERKDGYSSAGRNGGLANDPSRAMKGLDKVVLYTKPEYEKNQANATPIQTVKFNYDYSRCPNYPGNINTQQGSTTATETGKLTLLSIEVTYQKSKKMKARSYRFDYNSLNPAYNLKAVDRWGVYKPTGNSSTDYSIADPLTNADFPYTLQTAITNDYASAWHLTDIHLPSGGKIHVDYESDDYAFVQHKKANKMIPISGIGYYDGNGNPHIDVSDVSENGTPKHVLFSTNVNHDNNRNRPILFKFDNNNDDISDYVAIGQQVYFRILTDFKPDKPDNDYGKYDYVSGYGEVIEAKNEWINGKKYGLIRFKGEKLKENGSDNYSILAKAAILFGRMNLSRFIYDINAAGTENSDENSIKDLGLAFVNSIASFKDIFSGPNMPIYEKEKGVNLVTEKSWIRTLDPRKKKLGGGVRVKRISIHDNWNLQTNNQEAGYYYGQEFKYELEDGTSSGVATYEPMLGGDENPWHQPEMYVNEKKWAIDDKLFQESPMMESQFPSPSVGYSRVEITDIKRQGVNKTATGKVVKEFYTAQDFPTIVSTSKIDPIFQKAKLSGSFFEKYEHLTASQGFTIETNDMSGKPKWEGVYAEGVTVPLSEVNYHYAQDTIGYANGKPYFRLKNKALTINEDGSTTVNTIGVRTDVVADFRESETKSVSKKLDLNFNSFVVFFPIFIPLLLTSINRTSTRLRSATLNKTVQRFGILEQVVARQDGSVVATNNKAYDARTGEVLVTQTTTDFNDSIYSLNYPAYWKYKTFGQASQNIRYNYTISGTNSIGFTSLPANNQFIEGDEVKVVHQGLIEKAWVKEKNVLGIILIKKNGTPIANYGQSFIEVIRSGYRNKQTTSMASLTAQKNPINGLLTNQFERVINAGAIEMSDDWKTSCNCNNVGTNPYVNATKGNFRPVRSHTYLSNRQQTFYDMNTNIRRDGVFTAYSPFYKNVNGKWEINATNWTFVSEVTAFSPNGMTLETKDALNRYSASSFGFNNTLTTGVAANAKKSQFATVDFEDVFFNKGCDNSQFFAIDTNKVSVTNAHTGRNAISVAPSGQIEFSTVPKDCPTTDCAITVAKKTADKLTISGAIQPIEFEYQFLAFSAGSEIIDLPVYVNQFNEIQLDAGGSGVAPFKLIVSIKDANGCEARYLITYPGDGALNLNPSNVTISKLN